MTVVWVLDVVGYDARGGNARVFSTREAAAAAAPWVKAWKRYPSGESFALADADASSLGDSSEIYPRLLDEIEGQPWPEEILSEAREAEADWQAELARRRAPKA